MNTEIYTREYFLNDCEGFKQYLSSKSMFLSPRLKKVFDLAQIKEGMRVLDIGCGRGELVLHCADKGSVAIGIDSSQDAIKISEELYSHWLKKKPNIENKASFILSDCNQINFNESSFDVIFLSDIVEHLEQRYLESVLNLTSKILKPDGKIILHSSPNKIFIKYGLKIYYLLGRCYGKKLDWDMVKSLHEGLKDKFHVNEQTTFSLKKTFRKSGFYSVNIWLEKNPHYAYYFFKDDVFIKKLNTIYSILPIKHLFLADIYGVVGKFFNTAASADGHSS
ncbi:MAG: class I SAM-dependent methyltransferase [Elusimicrobia bacterium]|nr:class I SAM-dependent methyltransferase [Candidatus Liberimonas magnetica]